MRDMTKMNCAAAFAGESQANMRYLNYAARAKKDGFPNVARLFTAIAWAERVHASNHLQAMRDLLEVVPISGRTPFGIGDTSTNLQFGIDGETFEITEMYPAYLEVARFQDMKEAEQLFQWANEAEKIHAEMYKNAKSIVDNGKDIELDKVQICGVCGHTHEGDNPEYCPICGATKDKFKEFA